MGYNIEFVVLVLEYLERLEGLNDEDRVKIVDEVTEELSRDADRFLALYPLAHESLCFRYDYAYVAETTIYQFEFVVDAHYLAMGAVRVVYVEHSTQPTP